MSDQLNLSERGDAKQEFRHLGGGQTGSIFKRVPLTHAELLTVLHYNPNTGVFTWRKRCSNNTRIGRAAGCVSGGYIKITLQGVQHSAHRLAWFYVNGSWPDLLIDHRNSIGTDNRMSNLRLATRVENSQNQRAPSSNNKSGYLGVSLKNGGPRWVAQIKQMGRVIYLGTFDSKEDAAAAYAEAKKMLHPFQTIYA